MTVLPTLSNLLPLPLLQYLENSAIMIILLKPSLIQRDLEMYGTLFNLTNELLISQEWDRGKSCLDTSHIPQIGRNVLTLPRLKNASPGKSTNFVQQLMLIFSYQLKIAMLININEICIKSKILFLSNILFWLIVIVLFSCLLNVKICSRTISDQTMQ